MAPRDLVALASSALLLAACDLTYPWSSSELPDANVAATPASLAFQGTACDPSPPLPRNVRVEVDRRDVFLCFAIDPPGQFSAMPVAERELAVSPMTPPPQGGSHSATLSVYACAPDGRPLSRAAEVSLSHAVRPCPIALEPDAISLEVLAGMPAPAARGVAATTAEPDAASAWWAEIADRTCGSVDVGVSPASGEALPATLAVSAAPSSWPIIDSEYDCTATLRLRHGGRETTAPIQIHVAPQTVAFSPPAATFTAYTGQATLPPPQTIAVTPDRGPLAYHVSYSWPWSSVVPSGPAPGTFELSVTTIDWVPGTYEMPVTLAWAGGEARYPATYAVLPRSLVASPDRVGFRIDGVTTAAELTAAVALTSVGGPIAWSASVDAPWARLSRTRGVTGDGGGLAVSVDVDAVKAVPVGGSSGTLTVSYTEPNGASNHLSIPVGFWMGLPLVKGGLPHAVVADAYGASLTFGGGDFVAARDARFSIDGGAPLAPAWGWYDLANVALPPLAPGRHVLGVANALGLDRGTVVFDAVPPTTRAAASVAAPGRRTQLAFDDGRGVLYAANPGAGVVERYREADGWARDAVEVPDLRDAALATDGASVAAVARGTVRVVDTATFALAAAQPSGTLPGADAATHDWRLAFAADGRALVVSALPDVRNYGFFDGALVTDAGFGWCGGRPFAGADGRRIGIACPGHSPPYAPELYEPRWMFWGLGSDAYPPDFDADLVTFDPLMKRVLLLDLRAGAAADTLLLEVGWVYPYTLLPGKLPGTTVAALVTRDARRAVALDGATGNVRVFDLVELPPGASNPLRELGPPGGVAPAASPGASPVLALSADERTLFLAGDAGVVVVPLP